MAGEAKPFAAGRRGPPIVAAGPDVARRGAKWTAGFLLFVALIATLSSLQLYQLTAEGAAKRTLRRATAVLTEIDPLIDRNYDDLQLRAEAIQPNETVRLPDYPIVVDLSRDEALGASREDLRALLLDRSADRLYAEGTSALRADAEGGGDLGAFSVAGVTDNGLGFLRERNHDILAVLTVIFAAISATLVAVLVACCRGFGRAGAVGVVVAAAALPVLGGGIAARLYAQVAAGGGSEYLQREFFAIGEELAWIPIRTGASFAGLGLLLAATGWLLAIVAARRVA